MKILILGGSGQVGWELQRSLAPLGDIVVVARSALDLCDPGSVRRILGDSRPDAVVNAAAYTAVDDAEMHPQQADAINHKAVDILARLAASREFWLVHYSSDYVFDGSGSNPFQETSPTGPLNEYGRSKLAGDEAIAASGCKHLILRTSWVHAPRGKNFVRSILELAQARDHLRVVSDQYGAPTSAELIADVTARALEQTMHNEAQSGTYHIAAAGETSWHHIACHVVTEADRLGADLKLAPEAIEPIASADYPTPAVRPLNSRLKTKKLRDAFGLTLPDWQQGVRRTVAELVAA
ncbi:MAG: dTDP-4-dehydrorhamnose reductase [Alphaproteobacteria bacterium]|nr:dTDP-4-dehydrorhamnose reductase [Alphaproteobacteria bacterium]MBU1561638.1 dTDP-4-dehydrorhamnose reductase [Alphaproteobacteria bacterium]MBU2302381.1 dTDP-4-dehydrorhamnose reductase [Alphaproteobacteria bacterium]MBU2368661.1 dTDP-4-dehydrorhamnose reductase [Alphaproteobacteria bacterium]